MKTRSRAISVLSLAGAGNASYGLWQHYAPAGSAFCNVNATISCDIVNKSAFSEIFGIPVAAIGVLGFLALTITSLLALRRTKIQKTLLPLACAGLGMQLVLTGIEFGYLRAICPICVVSQLLIAAIAILALPLRPTSLRDVSGTSLRDV